MPQHGYRHHATPVPMQTAHSPPSCPQQRFCRCPLPFRLRRLGLRRVDLRRTSRHVPVHHRSFSNHRPCTLSCLRFPGVYPMCGRNRHRGCIPSLAMQDAPASTTASSEYSGSCNSAMAKADCRPTFLGESSEVSVGDVGSRNFSADNVGLEYFSTRGIAVWNFSAGNVGLENFSARGIASRNFSARDVGSRNFSAIGVGSHNFSARSIRSRNFSDTVIGHNNFSDRGIGSRNFSADGIAQNNFSASGVVSCSHVMVGF